MQVIRQIVKRESIKAVSVPETFGEDVEILVLPVNKTQDTQSESEQLMKLQEQTGFVKTILTDHHEDVWNDL